MELTEDEKIRYPEIAREEELQKNEIELEKETVTGIFGGKEKEISDVEYAKKALSGELN